MSQSVVIRQIVQRSEFIEGAQEHVDGLAGYVRDFLKVNGGRLDETGRAWSVESCADALKIPSGTLYRWLEQDKPSPVLPTAKAVQVKTSHAKAALRDPEQRRDVIASLPTDVRDELRADLLDVDVPPTARRCRHCPTHCPEGGH